MAANDQALTGVSKTTDASTSAPFSGNNVGRAGDANSTAQRVRVFVSFASPDEAIAGALVDHLRAEGLDVWYAPQSIRHGTDWQRQIDAAIRQADWLVLLVSRAARESPWVRTEVHDFVQTHRAEGSDRLAIIPLLLDETTPREVYLPLSLVQHIGFRGHQREMAAGQIVATILSRPSEMPRPPSQRGRRRLGVAAALLVLLAGAGWGVRPFLNWGNRPSDVAHHPDPPADPDVPYPGEPPSFVPKLRFAGHSFVLLGAEKRDLTTVERSFLTQKPAAYYLADCETTLAQLNAFYEETLQHQKIRHVDAAESYPEREHSLRSRSLSSNEDVESQLAAADVDPSTAAEYCKFLSRRSGSPGMFRLPFAGEWEFAALSPMHELAESTLLSGEPPGAWLRDNSAALNRLRLVGASRPTPDGVFDLFGNAREWAVLEHNRTAGGALGESYALAGGSYQTFARELQGDGRLAREERPRLDDAGFRVAMSAYVDTELVLDIVNKSNRDLFVFRWCKKHPYWEGFEIDAQRRRNTPTGFSSGWNFIVVRAKQDNLDVPIGWRYFGHADTARSQIVEAEKDGVTQLDLTVFDFDRDRP